MADIQASIRTSVSVLASITGGSAEAQFDVKGAKYVYSRVSGVKSHRASTDAVMDLVNQRGPNEAGTWRPNISRPEFRWSPKRGQTIHVVTEVIYANKIRIESDNKASGGGSAKASTAVAKVGDGIVSAEVSSERDGMWEVTAAEGKAFPFAFRVKKLEYDGEGNLKGNPSMKRSNSLSTKMVKRLTSRVQMAGQLFRSASVSNAVISSS